MMRPPGAEFQQVSECYVRRRSINWRALGMTSTTMDSGSVAGRVNAFDWPGLDAALQVRGAAVLECCLTASERRELAATYDDDGRFRIARRFTMYADRDQRFAFQLAYRSGMQTAQGLKLADTAAVSSRKNTR